MFSDNVEVDHLVGWTNGDWIVRLLVLYVWPLGIAVLAVAVAGAALLALSRVHNLFAEILIGLIALGVFAPALIWGVYRYIAVAFEMFRHATSWKWSLALAVGLCLLWALIIVPISRYVLNTVEPDRYSRQRYQHVADLTAGSVWGFLAVCTVLTMLADWFHRVASIIPIAAGGLLALIVIIVLAVAAQTLR